MKRISIRITNEILEYVQHCFPEYNNLSYPELIRRLLIVYLPLIKYALKTELIDDICDKEYQNSIFLNKKNCTPMSISFDANLIDEYLKRTGISKKNRPKEVSYSEIVMVFIDYICNTKSKNEGIFSDEFNNAFSILSVKQSLFPMLGSKNKVIRDRIYDIILEVVKSLSDYFDFLDQFAGSGNITTHLPDQLRSNNMLNELDKLRFKTFEYIKNDYISLYDKIQFYINKYYVQNPEDGEHPLRKLFDECSKTVNHYRKNWYRKNVKVTIDHCACYMIYTRLTIYGDSFYKRKTIHSLYALLNNMTLYHKALADITLTNENAFDLLESYSNSTHSIEKDTIIYLDPPYILTEDKCLNNNEMGFDHEKLAEKLKKLKDKQKISFFLSYRLTAPKSMIRKNKDAHKEVLNRLRELYGGCRLFATDIPLENGQVEIVISNRQTSESKELDEVLSKYM